MISAAETVTWGEDVHGNQNSIARRNKGFNVGFFYTEENIFCKNVGLLYTSYYSTSLHTIKIVLEN
jgi:hypothetical protein